MKFLVGFFLTLVLAVWPELSDWVELLERVSIPRWLAAVPLTYILWLTFSRASFGLCTEAVEHERQATKSESERHEIALEAATSRAERERALRIKTAAQNRRLRARSSEEERIRRTRKLFAGAARGLERAIQALPDRVPTESWSFRFARLVPEAFGRESQAPDAILSSLSYSLQSADGIAPRTAIGAVNEVLVWVVSEEIASDFDPGDGEWETWGPSKKLPFKAPASVAAFLEKLLTLRCPDSVEVAILRETEFAGGAPLKAFIDCRQGVDSARFSERDVLRVVYGEEAPEDDALDKEQAASAKRLCAAFIRAGLVTHATPPDPKTPNVDHLGAADRLWVEAMRETGVYDPPEFWLTWTDRAIEVERVLMPTRRRVS